MSDSLLWGDGADLLWGDGAAIGGDGAGVSASASSASAGSGSRSQRRRVLLDNGTIWEPATEADFQAYIADIIRAAEARREAPALPQPPKKRRFKAAVRSLAEIPKLQAMQPLPSGFYKTLDNNNADVLNSRLLAQAWADYMAEVEEDEDVTMLLLS